MLQEKAIYGCNSDSIAAFNPVGNHALYGDRWINLKLQQIFFDNTQLQVDTCVNRS
jgi:hypothetical protein